MKLPLVRFLASFVLARRYVVRGGSMGPAFRDGDCLLVDRLAYRRRKPVRGEVVVLRLPIGDESYLKRVVGLPGERVWLGAGGVLVDGEALSEPYLSAGEIAAGSVGGEWELGPQDYLVLGDRRADSWDSRRFGPVGVEEFVGPLLFRYWPPSRWGAVGS